MSYTRRLTAGEIRIFSEDLRGREIFGNSIDYDRVRIVSGGPLTIRGHAVVINHSIHVPSRIFHSDYSENSNYWPLLFHELTHVWQYQNRRHPELKNYWWMLAALEHIRYTNPYQYDPNRFEKLTDYGFEQQGRIVEDFVRSLVRGEPRQDLERIVRTALPVLGVSAASCDSAT